MNKQTHSIIGYCALVFGAIVIFVSLVAISRTDNLISAIFFGSSKNQTHVKKIPAEETDSKKQAANTIKNDIINRSELFNDSALLANLNIASDHIAFNEILSHSGNKIVYAELTNCPDERTGYADCAWDYSIKILDTAKKQTTTIYTQSKDMNSPSYHAIIYYPMAWSKNDKKIILGWYNLYFYGQGFSPSQYSVLDVNGGSVENPGAFIDCNAILFDSNTQAITATDKNGSVACAEGDNITPEQIIVTNAETGKTATIVGKEIGIGHAIKSFDPLTRTLVYTTFQCKETGQICETVKGGEVTTKQIKVITK